MAYKGTNDLGAIVPIKSEDLVMATCYTEAEQIAYKLTEGKDEFGDVDVEICPHQKFQKLLITIHLLLILN